MSKYLIEFTRFKASVIVEFDDSERIIHLEVNYGDMDPKTASYLHQRIPIKLAHLESYSNLKNTKVTEIPFDTSFETLWDTYANKFGNKGRAVKLWDALDNSECIKAIKYIQVYNQWLLMNSGVQKKLPETYLNQQPWNN